jgi:hypothetical protein
MTPVWTARRLGLGVVLGVAGLYGLSPALGAQTTAPPSGVILGRIVETDTDRGVAGAVVRLSAGPAARPAVGGSGGPSAGAGAGVSAAPNAITNASGHFLFRDVPSGTYTITVQAAGFLPASYGQRRPDGPPRSVQVDATRPPTNVTIRVWRPGAIEGTLRDELGDPLVGAAVRAMRRELHSTDASFAAAVATSTDDRGLFRLAPLPPGEYVVFAPSRTTSVPRSMADQLANAYSGTRSNVTRDEPQVLWNMKVSGTLISPEGIDAGGAVVEVPFLPGRATLIAPRPSTDGVMEVYRTTWYPAATTLSTASVLDIGPGEARTGVDIALELTRAFRVSGRLSVTDGPSSDQIIHLLPRDSRALGADPDFGTAVTLSLADGSFTLIGVPPGEYRLVVLRFGRPPNFPGEGEFADFNRRTLWADVPVSVTDGDVTSLFVPLADGARVEGRVVFDGTPPPAAAIQKMAVSLVPVDRHVHGLYGLAVPPDSTGAFLTVRYPPGRYFLTVSPPGAQWVVKSISVAGRPVADALITLAAADIGDVVATLTTRTALLSGTVRTTSSDPDVIVLLMPGDVERWIANGLPSSLSRTVAPGEDGRFRIDGLTTGDYLAVAIDAAANVNLGDAATIRALARAASAVSIVEGVDVAVTLPISQVR